MSAENVPEGLEGILKIDPEVMHGAVCFAGTRIPLAVFLDNLKEGMTVDEFLEDYSSVTRLQAEAVLAWQDRAIRKAAGLLLAS
jgi:uncharacterized protein (DUF433 family)